MISHRITELIKKILSLAEESETDIMFIGGIAVSAWAVPRATYDVDAVALINEKKINDFLVLCKKYGFDYDADRPVKHIQNLSFLTLSTGKNFQEGIYTDIFLARGKYFQTALKRKRILNVLDVRIPVVSPEDLILYKLLAGRSRDMEDVHEILLRQKDKLDIAYMKQWSEELGILYRLEDELRSSNPQQ